MAHDPTDGGEPPAQHPHEHPPPGHGEHDHGEEHNDEAELFPRVLTTRLVGDVEARRERRARMQAWALGIGLALVALGLPTGQAFNQAASPLREHVWSAPLPRAAIAWLAGLLEMPREPLGFLASGLFLGLSVPVFCAALRRIGFGHATSLMAVLAVSAAPLVWFHGTTAGDYTLGAVLAGWLLLELYSGRSTARILTVYGIGITLHLVVLPLLPAIVASRLESPSAGRPAPGRRSAWTVALIGTALGAVSLYPGLPSGPDHHEAGLQLYLGLALVGLLAPWLRTSREVARPPIWYALFLLVPIPALWLKNGVQGSWLLPLAAAGLADTFQRLGRNERGVIGVGLGALALQLVLTVPLARHVRSEAGDDWITWRETARLQLEPDDLVVSDGPTGVYYLTERWGLEVLPSGAPGLDERVREALAGGRRVVVDWGLQGEPPTYFPGFAHALREGGVTPPEAGP